MAEAVAPVLGVAAALQERSLSRGRSYSSRRAVAGSMRKARRAGDMVANTATSAKQAKPAAKPTVVELDQVEKVGY